MKKPSIKFYRRTLQISVAAAFVVIPYLNHHLRINYICGNFLSVRIFGLTLADPLAVLQVSVRNWYAAPGILMAAGLVLVLAACMGTVFCSWACPYGLLSEWVHGMARRLLPKSYGGLNIRISAFRVKVCIFITGMIFTLLFAATPVMNQFSMPAWYSRIFQYVFIRKHISLAAGVIAIILCIEFVSRNRLWCRYLCPQAVLLVLAKLANPYRLKVAYQKEKCLISDSDQGPCHIACSLSLNPRTLSQALETECTNCGDCITACKKMGQALRFQLKGDKHKGFI
ncbi:MAG: 4Fe-4S binding protein [Desulfobacterales bacterium]|nr:4Fe-4S binding protein [Desulfobacterales bacterium]